jgi:hypothetical protein
MVAVEGMGGVQLCPSIRWASLEAFHCFAMLTLTIRHKSFTNDEPDRSMQRNMYSLLMARVLVLL